MSQSRLDLELRREMEAKERMIAASMSRTFNSSFIGCICCLLCELHAIPELPALPRLPLVVEHHMRRAPVGADN